MKKLLLLIICLVSTCFADNTVPHLYILHINGINTERDDAKLNAMALENASNIQSNMMTFSFVYNPTKGGDKNPGLWTNLMDVAQQKMFEGKDSMTLDDFTRAWIFSNGQDPDRMSPAEYAATKAGIEADYIRAKDGEFGNNIDDIINNFHGNVPVEFRSVVDLLKTPYVPHPLAATYQIADKQESTPSSKIDLFKVFAEYNKTHPLENHSIFNYSKTKNMVLLVPHSQGNLYANDLYTYLIKAEHFPENQLAVYGIASPAMRNNGDWIAKIFQEIARVSPELSKEALPLDSYITSIHDFVINSARVIFYSNPAMPGNINIPWFGSPIGHNLIDVYLSNSTSRAQIAKMIVLEAFYLTSSPTFTSDGVRKIGLAMASSMFQFDSTVLKDDKEIICDINGCSNNVLFMSPVVRYDNNSLLYFPQNKFGNKSYKILRDYGESVAIMLPDELPDHQSFITCDEVKNHVVCTLNQYISTQGAAYSFVPLNMLEYWGYAQSQYPHMFQDGMFITNEFTVP